MKKKSNYSLEKFVVGPMAVNCYCLWDPGTKEACLIDPGADAGRLKKFLSKHGLILKYIINTHGHGDHIAANGSFDCPVYIHRLDKDYLKDPEKNLSKFFIFSVTSPEPKRLLEDDDTVILGELKLRVIHTPGHTPGSVSIKTDGILFTGDTLFRGGVGRTDLYGGDEGLLMKSIKEKLLVFDDEIIVYPGHGESSTIGEEKANFSPVG